jgi:predicted permease
MTVAESARSLWLLFGSVSLLLLIACTNIAALLLARTADREQEISIRLSLGASRLSVMTRLLAEVFVLALAGSALGLLVAGASSGVFRVLAKNMPRVEEIELNWTLVGYCMVCAVAATLVCGVVPALRVIRRSSAAATPQSSRGLVSTRSPLQWLLVGIQISLSVALLAGAGLLLRSFRELGRVSTGFETARILTFRVSANWAETTDLPGVRRRIDRTLEALRALPGVENAATTLTPPGIAFAHPEEFRVVEGSAEADKKIVAHSRYVSDGYFETMRIALLAGEGCRADPAGMTTALVNRSFVDAYLGATTATGLHLEFEPKRSYSGSGEIRGVVADAREEGLNHSPGPLVYWCNSGALPSPLFVVRTSAPPLRLVESVRTRIHELEPLRSVYDVAPLTDRLDEAFAENRLRTVLLTFFALTAISLACLGAYGTLSYFVNVRRREVGLRIALGARRTEIVGQFFGMGMRVCLVGGLVGLIFAVAAGRTLAGVLYGVSSSDPLTLAGVILLVLLTGAAASLLPALRAARVDPMQVLRDE